MSGPILTVSIGPLTADRDFAAPPRAIALKLLKGNRTRAVPKSVNKDVKRGEPQNVTGASIDADRRPHRRSSRGQPDALPRSPAAVSRTGMRRATALERPIGLPVAGARRCDSVGSLPAGISETAEAAYFVRCALFSRAPHAPFSTCYCLR